jgi:hypothetical protein
LVSEDCETLSGGMGVRSPTNMLAQRFQGD